MYMTRVMLKRIPRPDTIHSVLSGAFPGKRNAAANENLWRIDELEYGSALIIVSAIVPVMQYIVDKIGIDDIRNKSLDYNSFLKRIVGGKTWKFRICANPVEHKKDAGDTRRGKVYALRSVPEQFDWLDKQGLKHGFSVNGCDIIKDEWRIIKDKEIGNWRNNVHIRAVTFDGLLTVTEADTFRTSLTKGFGRGKAYGCGLLTIANVQT